MEISDSLGLSGGRKAEQLLGGMKIEMGSGTWTVDGSLVLQDAAVTSGRAEGGTAFHPLPAAVGIHRIAVEICPAGVTSCTGLALFKANPAGNFFGASEVSILLSRNGGYAINVKGVGVIKQGSRADYPDFRENGFNKLELVCDSVANTVSARINRARILDAFALKADSAGSLFLYAGFRLNGPLTPGAAKVRNYSLTVTPAVSAGLVPLDLSQLFFEPQSLVGLRFKVGSVVPDRRISFTIGDYQGNDVLQGMAEIDAAGECVVPVKLPRGYYDLRFPASRETFGLVALEKADRADPFFCIDSGLSWLELSPQRRTALVKILARCGIAMSRERLGLGGVNPVPGRFNWECGNRSCDAIRKTYAVCKVPVLEILDGRSRHHGVIPESPYPQDLPEMAAAWTQVAGHWQTCWGGAEVGNEPDLKTVAADQYVLNAKVLSYALAQAGSPAPLVSGVFATIPPGPFFDTCVANGMLADSNAVSFHSYDRASDIESMVVRYRAWLKEAGHEAMPLWHSECGWAWTCGPARPPRDEDARSAVEIAAKAAESRACGVARHFPFVYVYYEEGRKNFGMMGRDATALRSMAGYATCAKTLAGRAYLGDLQGLPTAVKFARVFDDPHGGECVAVLYTGKVDPKAAVPLPTKVKRVSGVDGRDLPLAGGRAPIPDGMAYAWISPADLGASLKTDTTAAKLSAIGAQALQTRRLASPVVLQFVAAETPSRGSVRQYLVTQESARALPLKIRVHNLGKTPAEVAPELQLPGAAPERVKRVTVPALGCSDVSWRLDASKHLDIATTRFITVRADAAAGVAPSPLAIPMIMDGTLEQHLKRHPRQRPLPLADLKRWTANIAGHGKATFSAGPEGWRMDASFSGAQGNWAYPKFALPEKLDPTADSGFLLRARIAKPAGNIAILAIPGRPDDVGFWTTDLFPADGAWHVVYIPFGEFKPGPNQTGNQNARLDPASWKTLAVGMGSRGAENTIEVSHFLVVGGAGKE
jgi:hypothetical protein